MGTFDTFGDSPFQIRTEGQEITINFTRTGPNSGRVSWDIPTPAQGCSADEQAYNGIVVTFDTAPASLAKSPIDGTTYTADPTADSNLHAGDAIGSALVIGAFYDDKTTTSFDITGISEDAPIYISGYAVDAQYRYHRDGVHAYSLDYKGGNESLPTSGYQTVTLGVDGTDATGLTPNTNYTFAIDIDGTEYPVSINSDDAPSYDQLAAAINDALSKVENPTQGPTAPNTGTYYWNTTASTLYQWDGTQHNLIDALVEDTAPNNPVDGDYWYNTDTGVLSIWDTGAWVTKTFTSYSQDPTTLTGDDYWFNGTTGYLWDGTTWCEKLTWVQATDPSLPVYPSHGSYWYDTTNLFLYKWNDQTTSWVAVNAIYWDVNPSTPTVGSFWFDETNIDLKQWSGASWTSVSATISSTEPVTPAPNMYWYNDSTEELKQRDGTNTVWVDINVLALADDPTSRDSCDLWWNSIDDNLYVWDVTTASWDLVSNFDQQATDPAAAPTLSTEDVWYDSANSILYRWDGSMWVAVTFIELSTDPTIVALGDVWFDTTTNKWHERGGSPVSWTEFDPVESATSPNIPTTGTLWYDTTNNVLNQWDGAAWNPISFTTMPLTPSTGTLWYDTINSILKEWNGTEWIASTPIANTTLTTGGDLKFTSATTGSTSSIVLTDGTLFSSLQPTSGILEDYVVGTDGIDPEPMYQQVGVGDDGTPEERRELMDSIRQQLGYPVVEVELTKYQMDTAITAALEALRKRSAAAYHRAFFFVDIPAGEQSVRLTNKSVGFNKIVTVMGAHRISSSFLSTAYGSGVYGQVVLQHLYNMGTFDLLSYHLMNEYIEQLEQLFATRLVFQWNEHSRQLNFYQTFATNERILIDASIERTEQELLTDRWTKSWIEKYASAQARLMLSEIRGKYASLPGAGGGISLNAAELITRAETDIADCYDQLDNFVVNSVEDYGIGTTFVIG